MKKFLFAILAMFAGLPAYAECTSDENTHALALNMYYEARDQGHDGMLLVGEVTMNRVNSRHFPDSICGVVYQGRKDQSGNMIRHRCQFSWYCDGKPDNPTEEKSWEIAQDIANSLINGEIEYLGTEATHYLNPDKVSRMPRWTRVYSVVGYYGDHLFYAMGDRL